MTDCCANECHVALLQKRERKPMSKGERVKLYTLLGLLLVLLSAGFVWTTTNQHGERLAAIAHGQPPVSPATVQATVLLLEAMAVIVSVWFLGLIALSATRWRKKCQCHGMAA